jgi:hypothetical protein
MTDDRQAICSPLRKSWVSSIFCFFSGRVGGSSLLFSCFLFERMMPVEVTRYEREGDREGIEDQTKRMGSWIMDFIQGLNNILENLPAG